MRRTFPLLLLLVLIPFAYYGCNHLFNPAISKASVSKSNGFGDVNPDFLAVFADSSALDVFRQAMAKAKKRPGIVDAALPDYDVEILYSNGSKKGLHLWLHPQEPAGSLMYVSDTHYMYALPNEIAGRIQDLLRPYTERFDPVREKPSSSPSEEPDAGGQMPDYRSADIFSLVAGDIPITIGAWDHEIDLEAILGPPAAQSVEVLDNADTHTGSYVKKMDYDGLQLELFSPKQNGETFWVRSMKVIGNGYRTTRDIQVGSALEDLLLEYPEIGMAPDGRTDPDNAAYVESDATGERFLRFEVADGRVTEIHIYRELP